MYKDYVEVAPLTEHPAVGGEGEVGHAGVEAAAPGPVTIQNPPGNWNTVWLQEPGLVLLRLSAETQLFLVTVGCCFLPIPFATRIKPFAPRDSSCKSMGKYFAKLGLILGSSDLALL